MLVAATTSPAILHQRQQAEMEMEKERGLEIAVPSVPVSLPVPIQSVAEVSVSTILKQIQEEQEQLHWQLRKIGRGTSPVPISERMLAVQLAHLASQHHTSEYSRLKYGTKRPPTFYIPMSFQSLEIRTLRTKQKVDCRQQAWWFCDKTKRTNSSSVPVDAVQSTHTKDSDLRPAVKIMTFLDIQREVTAARSPQSPIPPFVMKTSQTHPINISRVIPHEYVPMIVSSLSQPKKPSPYMFEVPPTCQLDRITAVHIVGSQTLNSPVQDGVTINLVQGPQPVHPNPPIFWAQPGGAHAPIIVPSQAPTTATTTATSRRVMSEAPLLPNNELPPGPSSLPGPVPPSPPSGVIRRQPRHERAASAPPMSQSTRGGGAGISGRTSRDPRQQRILVYQKSSTSSDGTVEDRKEGSIEDNIVPFSVLASNSVSDSEVAARTTARTSTIEDRIGSLGKSLTQNPTYLRKVPPQTSNGMPVDGISLREDGPNVQLGNFYLSSCPGKKVRLTGPVKGRGSICRDLRSDLTRVRDLGVGCIICCLDDNELEFLGVEWSEYTRIANELNLDVLRIPTPEGLTPLSPEILDEHLTHIIEWYTLRGIPVLAHCRGGVGRAGLVSCCWMLKMGLCGWKDPSLCASTHPPPQSCSPGTATYTPYYETYYNQGKEDREQDAFKSVMQAINDGTPAPPAALGTLPVPRVCRATVELVQKVLMVVRRRRSLKAIETYEQVRFLVDYIEYLDGVRRRGVELPQPQPQSLSGVFGSSRGVSN